MEWYWIVLIAAAGLVIAANIAVAVIALQLTVSKKGVAKHRAKIDASGAAPSPYRSHTPQARAWWETQKRIPVSVQGAGGIKLNGWYLPAEKTTNKCALVMHGHDCDSASIAFITRMFSENGWNVLAPEMRAGAFSGGSCYSFGYYESRDALAWLEEIKRLCGDNCRVAAYGNSLGGGTVCMLSGLETPPQLRCIVSDCAYTSLRGVVDGQLKAFLPAALRWLPLTLASIMCKIRYGFFFADARPVSSVKHAAVPMFFVHGELDPLIPPKMCYELFAACGNEKQQLMVAGMKHGEAYFGDPQNYTQKICGFCERFCG